MDTSYINSVFKAYLETYKHRNLETKEIEAQSCANGIEWAWLTLGECLVSQLQIAGYLIGALSLPFWLIGSFMLYAHVFRSSVNCLWNVLVITVVVNLISFVGAVMSMQILLVISIDFMSTAVEVITMFVVAVVVLRRHCTGAYAYNRVLQEGPVVSPSSKTASGMLSCRLCCLPLCLVVTSIFSVVFVTVVGTNAAREITSDTSSSTELSHPTALSTVGYVLGCFASFGHWWCEILCLRYGSQCTKEMFSNRLWKGGGVFLIIHDLFYILGILMQSGGIKIAIVSLPWLMGRVVQACFQLFKLSSTKWSKICMLDGSDREDGDDIEGCDDNIIDVEAVNLLGSSDSESSEIHVLWDRSWKIPGKPQVHVHYDELPTGHAHMSSSQGPVSTAHHAGASTTDSDWSSTSQEQELVWENFAPPSRLHLRNGIYAKSEFENLSQIAGLSEKHPETFDQRVRSWISQSTPEEETPPCLTMTLNLETNHDSIDDTHNINFGNRKVISPWSLRKNSY